METGLIPADRREAFVRMAENLNRETDKAIEAASHTFKKRSNRLSGIGQNCSRFLAMEWEYWEEVEPFDADTLRNMQKGIVAEEWAVTTLKKAYPGKLVELQTDMILEENITGHIDFALLESAFADDPTPYDENVWPDRRIVIDAKCTNMYRSLNSIDDILAGKFSRRWAIQLNGYIKGAMEKWGSPDYGFILLIDPEHYKYDLIPMVFNQNIWDWTVHRAREINRAVETGRWPAQINNPIECQQCRLFHVCTPTLDFKDCVAFYESDGLEEEIKNALEWKPLAKAWKKLDDANKTKLKALHDRDADVEDFVVGETFINCKTNKAGARTFTVR